MSGELQKKLPKGVAVIFFENIGRIHSDGDFNTYASGGYFAIAYSYDKECEEPSETTRKDFLNENKNLVGLSLTLKLLSQEEESFSLFGTREEIENVKKALRDCFGSENALVIKTNTQRGDFPYSWWTRE